MALCQPQTVPVPRKSVPITAIVKIALGITKKRMNGHSAQGNFAMAKNRVKEDFKKREKIQTNFWNQVGSEEHISVPMLQDAIKKEFNKKDDRFIKAQIKLMQTEARIRIESRVKVWIKQPNTNFTI